MLKNENLILWIVQNINHKREKDYTGGLEKKCLFSSVKKMIWFVKTDNYCNDVTEYNSKTYIRLKKYSFYCHSS